MTLDIVESSNCVDSEVSTATPKASDSTNDGIGMSKEIMMEILNVPIPYDNDEQKEIVALLVKELSEEELTEAMAAPAEIAEAREELNELIEAAEGRPDRLLRQPVLGLGEGRAGLELRGDGQARGILRLVEGGATRDVATRQALVPVEVRAGEDPLALGALHRGSIRN